MPVKPALTGRGRGGAERLGYRHNRSTLGVGSTFQAHFPRYRRRFPTRLWTQSPQNSQVGAPDEILGTHRPQNCARLARRNAPG